MSDFETQLATQPHDAFFKVQFSNLDNARALFQAKLPPSLVAAVNWTGLKLEPVSFIKPSLKQLHSDLIFSAPIAEHSIRISLIFEHQTTVDPLIPMRLGDYLFALFRQQVQAHGLPLSPPLCLVIHQGPEPWNVSTHFADLFALPESLRETLTPFVPQFQYLLLDLTRIDPTQENEPQLRIILNLMKLARFKDQMLQFFEWLDADSSLTIAEPLFNQCLLYSLHVDPHIDVEDICATFHHNKQLASLAMTAAQKLREEGRQEGRQEGLWIGRIQLLQQLIHQPVSTDQDLSALSIDQLQETFTSLESQYNAAHKR
jgi:predicted transposase/invertase (TIGR01784 family)